MKKKMTQTTKTSGRLCAAATMTALLLVVLYGHAQNDYHPIADGCTWSVSDEKYMTAGDTVIDGKTYHKIYKQTDNQPFEFNLIQAEYFAAIRNDTAGRKVYAYLPAGTWVRKTITFEMYQTEEAQEVLLFDFTLHTGDTTHFFTLGEQVSFECEAVCAESAHIWCGEHNGQLEGHQYDVGDSLVYLSDNSSRRQLFLNNTSSGINIQHVWIEGIGSIYGNDELVLMGSDAGYKILLCFTDNKGAQYQTGFDFDNNPTDCFNNGFGSDVPERVFHSISVYPNPTDDILYVELSGAGIQSVGLYDLQGRVVGANNYSPLQGTAMISVRNVPAGVYVLRVTDENGREYHSKIVVR